MGAKETSFESGDYKESNKLLKKFNKVTDHFNVFIASIAGVSLISMMLLVVFNAFIRTFTSPISGTVEIVGWLAALTAMFSLGYAQLYKAHVYIDLLIIQFPIFAGKIIHTFMNIISIIFFLLAGWNLILYGISLMNQGVLSETIEIPFYPFVLLCSIGLVGLLLSIIRETFLIWGGGSK